MQKIRIHKYLAERGVASRRQSESFVKEGRVTINGEPASLGSLIDPSKDRIALDGNIIPAGKPESRTIVLNKPRGYICSASSRQGKTVYELIKGIDERLVPVGRLDKNSEGLLLMSNDGELVNRLTHPRYEQEKTYKVTVSGAVTPQILEKLQSRMIIDGYRIQPAKVKLVKQGIKANRHILEIVLKEGRNRQIRRMCDQADLKIHRLVRVRIKDITLEGLEPGQWRDLTQGMASQ